MKLLQLAVGFLTTVPVRLAEAPRPGDLGRSAFWFPWVGLVLGGALYAVYWLLGLGFPPALVAVLLVIVWAAFTGGLHLDGLADCCDGLLAAASIERRLEILRDPRLGTFGGAGLVLHLLLKVSLVAALVPGQAAWPLLLAPVLGRWLILLVASQPAARPGGLGADFSLGLNRKTAIAAALLPLAMVVLGGPQALLAAGLAHLAVLGVLRLARARLGGVTGDVMGLAVELGETAVLLAFVARF
jgi:adenosylcobinamide-GDP ribazoletransferase